MIFLKFSYEYHYATKNINKAMKTLLKTSALFLIIISVSCTDVIDVTVQDGATRLVIEASLDWEKGTTGSQQTIQLSNSTSYFDEITTSPVSGASVIVTNDSDATKFIFTDENNGDYTTYSFVPVIGQSYTMQVIYNGETYTATETLNAIPEITDIYQTAEDGFDTELLEVHVIFNDPEDEENNYLFKFQKRGVLLPDLEIGYDEFVNGNEIDWWSEAEENEDTEAIEAFTPGDIVDIEMYGISTPYKDYMEILTNQLEEGGLFDTTPVALKGNCINLANPANYAHGYFRLTEVNKTSYTFVEK